MALGFWKTRDYVESLFLYVSILCFDRKKHLVSVRKRSYFALKKPEDLYYVANLHTQGTFLGKNLTIAIALSDLPEVVTNLKCASASVSVFT